MSRSLRASNFGALIAAVAVLVLPTHLFAAAKVIITEIHYNPAGSSDQLREFIELKNVGDEAADMGGWQFTNGVIYTFPTPTTLAPGGFLVLAANKTSFETSYGVTAYGQFLDDGANPVAGQPALDGGGERVTLKDGPDLTGNTIFSFKYGDGKGFNPSPHVPTADEIERSLWPDSPDGGGYTLVSLDPNANPDEEDYRNWRPSLKIHGSPGADEPLPVPFQPIYINEIRSRDGAFSNDAVELYNPGSSAVDVSNWFISDNIDNPLKSPIPADTVVPAGGYVVLQNGIDGFALSISSKGERAFLYSATAANVLTGWVHGFHTEASKDGNTFARFVDSSGKEQLLADDPSLSADNGEPSVASVVITEIMYSPAYGAAYDYIKIKNVSGDTVMLYDNLASPYSAADANMRIGGFSITIPGNLPELVAGEEAYVTSELEADFRVAYSVDAAVKVFSGNPDGGNLSGGGELIELRMPITIDGVQRDDIGYPRYYTVIDEVCYDDDAPWPTGADGSGRSIVKIDETQPGYEPSNWTESEHRGGTAYSGDIVLVNEILAHTDNPRTDVIELFNPGSAPVDLEGWFLTDDPLGTSNRFFIPAGQSIPAGGYWAINEDNDFNPNSVPPAGYFGSAFSIGSRGDSVYLFSSDGVTTTGYSHGADFRATANAVSLIRHVNSAGAESFPPQAGAPTHEVNANESNPDGMANNGPRVERAVISEIFYAPGVGDVEFIEIANISGSTLSLYDDNTGGNTANNWQLDGVTFTFPGVHPTIPTGGRVVIIPQGEIEADFRALYAVPAGVAIYGGATGYTGSLRDGGEEIALLRPDKPDDVPNVGIVIPLIPVDAINYENSSPWPTAVGKSIERIDESAFGDEPQNWQTSYATVATPGQPNSSPPGYDSWAASQFTPEELAGAGTGAGDDFNNDGYNNLHAYAFGFSPKEALPGDKLPQVTITGAGVDETLAISFRQADVAPDLTYRVQRSSDLKIWTDIDNPVGAPVDNSDGTQTVVHADDAVISGGDESFLRVLVELAAP
jgi:hypothetical protein